MGLNCTDLDNLVDSAADTALHNAAVFYASVVFLIGVSLALITHGEKLVRPLAGVAGGVVGAAGIFLTTGLFERPPSCEIRLAAAGIAGVILAALAICVLKTALFLVGGVGLASVAHLVWESLPVGGVEGPFTLFSRPGWYYVAVGGSAVVGAVVSQAQKERFTQIVSSTLGGSGVAAGVYLVSDRSGERPPALLLLGVVVACSILGTVVQHRLSKRRKERKRRATVPIGRPVS